MPSVPTPVSPVLVAMLVAGFGMHYAVPPRLAPPVRDRCGSMATRYGLPGRLAARVTVVVGAWLGVGTLAMLLVALDVVPWTPTDGFVLASLVVPLMLVDASGMLRLDRARRLEN
jgi:hypothetical protein